MPRVLRRAFDNLPNRLRLRIGKTYHTHFGDALGEAYHAPSDQTTRKTCHTPVGHAQGNTYHARAFAPHAKESMTHNPWGRARQEKYIQHTTRLRTLRRGMHSACKKTYNAPASHALKNMSENRMISGHAPNRTCRTFLGPAPWNKNILRTFGHLGWYLMAVRGPLVRHLGLVPSGATWTRQRAGFRPSRGLPRDLLECGLGSAADYIVLLPSFRTSTERQGG